MVIDYRKLYNELRRCPKCDQIIKQKFSLTYKNKPVSDPPKDEEKLNITIYKCPNCGYSWNRITDYNEYSH